MPARLFPSTAPPIRLALGALAGARAVITIPATGY